MAINTNNYTTPILFIIFNRAEVASITFEAIKKIKPQKLYIAADGPRENSKEDIEKCKKTREIVKKIDWDCEVKTLFREENIGVVKGVTSAVDWLFEHEEKGIILEDDCFPSDTFFTYACDLLEKYENNEKIMHISGSNFIETSELKETSYYFSKFASCWGWASWRRAWQKYDINLIENISEKEYLTTLKSVIQSKYHYNYFQNHLNYHRKGDDNIWDWRWTFCIWYNNGIVINPKVNLIKNIGYGEDATTSKGENEARNKISELKLFQIENVQHPKNIEIDLILEKRIQNIYNPPLTLKAKIKRTIGFFIPEKMKLAIKNILNIK